MIRRLLLFNGIAILLVVVHHSVNWVLTAMFWWTDRYRVVEAIPDYAWVGTSGYYFLRVLDQFASAALPVFLLVSGFFVAASTSAQTRHLSWSSWRTAIGRLRTLLVAYLLWSLLIVGLRFVEGQQYGAVELLRLLWRGEATPPYYYVPMLIKLYLLSPLLVWWAQRKWQLLLAVTFLIQLPQLAARYLELLKIESGAIQPLLVPFRDSYLVELAFWFVLGVVIQLNLTSFKQFLSRHRRLIFWAWLGAFCLGILEWELVRRLIDHVWFSTTVTFFNKVYAFSFLLVFLAYSDVKFPWATQFAQLGSKSYGIYLTHILFLEATARITYHVLPQLFHWPLVFQLLLVVVATVGPFLLIAFVERTPLRRYHVYLFG